MQWKKTAVSAVILCAGCVGLFWHTKNEMHFDTQPVQTSDIVIRQEIVQTVSGLGQEIEKEELAHKPIDIAEFGGWPEQHAAIGTLRIPDANIECDIIFGDNSRDLNRGACFYADKKDRIPGGGTQMLMASHNNSFFHTLGEVKEGSRVYMDLYYGEYEYEVVRTEVVKATDTTTYDLDKTEEEVILYTCYPFDMLSATPYRFFVYCKPVYARPLQK